MDSHYKNTYVMFFYVKPCDRFIFCLENLVSMQVSKDVLS